jgi:ABC-type glycerol-3-phosphate transport system substrate-binding protein
LEFAMTMNRRQFLGAAGAGAFALGLGACGDDGGGSDSGAITGEITVLTQRTDIVSTIFQDYKKTFEAKYPGTTVKFEAIKDYEGEVRIRMNTKDYGDVLLIPGSVTKR